MIKKISLTQALQAIFFVVIIIVFSLIFWKQYLENYEKNNTSKITKENLEKNIKSFELSKIRDLENTYFKYTPDKEVLNKIVEKIDNSKKRVYVEVYMITENRIKQALKKAKDKWINVKVLIEKNPYKANNINNKHYSFLEKSWIEVKWSDPDKFSLNHSKFLIIDDEAIVSTGNLTYSSFTFNRDMFLFLKDKEIVKNLLNIFEKDFWFSSDTENETITEEKIKSIYNHNLVVSPEYSRIKIEKMFLQAEKNIKMYFQYLSDQELIDILIEKSKKGVEIEIIIDKTFYDEQKEKIKNLEEYWIKIRKLEKIKMHSKAILTDGKYLFIGSINFSRYSLDKNREVWILLTNKEIIKDFETLFEKDS